MRNTTIAKQNVSRDGIRSIDGIPVNIPVEAFSWPRTPGSQGIYWELTVQAPLRGLDSSAVFGTTMDGQPSA